MRRGLLAGVLAASLLATPALAGTSEVQETLEGEYWFVQDVSESDGVTTVRFAWTDSYFAANACVRALAAAGKAPAKSVAVAFGDAEPRSCVEVAADPNASIATAPAEG